MGVIYRVKPGVGGMQMQSAEIPKATWLIEVGQTHPGLPGSYRDEIVTVDYENRWYRRRDGHPQPFPDRWVRCDDLVWVDCDE